MFSLVLNFQKDSWIVNILVHFRPTLWLYDVFLFIDLKLAKDIAKVAYTYYKYAPQELTFWKFHNSNHSWLFAVKVQKQYLDSEV